VVFRAVLALALLSCCTAFQASGFLGSHLANPALFLPRSFSSSAARARPLATSSRMFGLRMQLDGMPGGEKVDGPGAEMTEEMMMLIALQQREKMALPEGSKVIVFGALDRLGQIVVRMLAANGRYKPAIQTSEGYLDQMRMTVDGVEPGFPPEAQVAIEEIPADVSAAILCLEKVSDVETLKVVLGLGLPLKKFVLLSKIGVDSRENDWKLKLNPFLKLDEWAALEDTLKETADLSGFDYSIVRVGDLSGGPFYDTNRDFSQALEDRIFDAEAKGCVLKSGDQDSGKVTRDAVAQLLVECLARPDAANKVMSLRSVKEKTEGAVLCDEQNYLGLPPARKNRARNVFTPSKDQWAKAFANAFP